MWPSLRIDRIAVSYTHLDVYKRQIQAKQEGNLFILDTTQIAKEHDRKLIEESFQDFEKGLTVSEIEMVKAFGKYGWSE